jgi:Uma2 family endonuclease
MSTSTPVLNRPEVIYPESDGLPVADNTKQFRWMVTIQGGLDAIFMQDPNVFVAANLLWYPIEGDNEIRIAPDVFVAKGRPKGDRGSYQQWLENNIVPQVVFEIVSPGNRAGKLTEKFDFYNQHGVEEYYLYDPDDGDLDGWLRKGGKLTKIKQMKDWISPLLHIRFDLVDGELRLFRPDGRRFSSYVELEQEREQERLEKEKAQQRAERLAAKLRELGIDPEQ